MEETTMKVKSTILMVAILVIVSASGVFAQQGPFNCGERVVRFLGLSEAQLAQWTAIHEEMQAKLEPIRDQRRLNRTELQGELQAVVPNALKIGELVIANHGLGLEATGVREETHARIMAMLTPEQQEKFQQMIQRQRGRRGGLGDGAGFGGDCLGDGSGIGTGTGNQQGRRPGSGRP
ncbi:MAG: Spy/CpxP family protein refolding chaperone [Thermoanaerobaculia bacterium]